MSASRRILGVVAVLLAVATPARAQSDPLARVVSHIDDARFDSARAELARWQIERAASAPPSERAVADVLGARLERDGSAARDAWLSVALSHPFGPDAGLALLRVGQAAVLQGDTATALVYLTRLVDDFPGSGHRAEAHLWIARAHSLARRPTDACASARAGLAAANSAEVGGLLRIQEERACSAAASQPQVATRPAPPPVADRAAPAASTGRFAVQSGAFRARAGADALTRRLRDGGHAPRLVRVPGSELMRVRVGRFEAQSDAVRLRDQLRSAGFDAVVVTDARSETAVP